MHPTLVKKDVEHFLTLQLSHSPSNIAFQNIALFSTSYRKSRSLADDRVGGWAASANAPQNHSNLLRTVSVEH
jgi:hypothetical protein